MDVYMRNSDSKYHITDNFMECPFIAIYVKNDPLIKINIDNIDKTKYRPCSCCSVLLNRGNL